MNVTRQSPVLRSPPPAVSSLGSEPVQPQAASARQASTPAAVDAFTAPRAAPVQLQAASASSVFASNALLSRYQPTGASATTASQDGLPAGVASSHRMADADRQRVLQYKPQLMNAAAQYGVPPALLAAIASRESRGGAALDRNGLGDHGNGFGLMQVDKRYHTPQGGPFSQAHINQAASILRGYLDESRQKFPSWPPEQQMRAAVVAYNSGMSNVRTQERMDVGTTGNDYSNDVWARAQRLSNDFGGVSGNPGTGPGPNPTPGNSDLSKIPAGTTLASGDRGENVRILQNALNKLGYGLEADGAFGGQTERAVKDFQGRNGLTADGLAGPKTLQALARATQAGPTDPNKPGTWTPAPSLADVRAGKAQLRQGMEGEAVRFLQRRLGLEQDGKFGPATKQAVADYQRRNGLTPPPGLEGVVGKTTLEHLERSQGTGGVNISARGQEQMRRIIDHARNNHQGGSYGDCMKFVWGYMTSSGYGKLDNWNDLPAMDGGLARGLPDYLNASPAHLKEAGLQRLDTALSPPVTNPHDSRIPPGAIIVVAPGSYGTRHPTAGDIVVKGTRPGEFINDGPAMNYGTANTWHGRILGVYVPE